MRTIKFRGKQIDTGEWIYNINIFDSSNSTPPINPNTIGQFTGLYDKNGKEIYEGDIVKSIFTTYIVKWNKEDAYFSIEEDDTPHLLADYVDDIEVIGNIYDNQELLK